MVTSLKILRLVFFLLVLPMTLFAQKDVTQFLGIAVDGYKPDVIKKLNYKGYTVIPNSNDVLGGEFNGTDVWLMIGTNNNLVWQISVVDANTMDAKDIKIRFNNLLKQFQHNKKYLDVSDSMLLKNIIPENEDISYEFSVNPKKYRAFFSQKTFAYDSLNLKKDALLSKPLLNATEKEQLAAVFTRIPDELFKCFKKSVMLWIGERSGKYYIIISYQNEYNRPNGENL
jgi:hypothetical protein